MVRTIGRWMTAAVLTAPLAWSPAATARPDQPGSDLFTFDVGDDIVTFDTEHFRFHYTTAGTHRVPAGDANVDGVPDHVARLAEIYEDALATYVLLGFRAPVSDVATANNGGDERFDVYLVDFGLSADGAYRAERCEGAICSGYMVQENDFAGYGYPSVDVGNRTVASHELFHAVQAAYDTDQGAVIAEGTAVWASERYDATLRDLEGFAFGYLDNAATPLDSGRGGPVDAFTYGAGIFFEYLSERFDDDVTLELWESVADDSAPDAFWFSTIEGVLQSRGSSFGDAFAEFSAWTLRTGRRADTATSFENGGQMVERDALAKTMPIAEPSFVVFTASSRLMQAPLGGRTAVQVGVAGDAANTDGVHVYALGLTGTGGPIGDVVDVGVGVGVSDLDLPAGASQVLVLVVNANPEGRSARPTICVGDADEVAACTAPAEGEGEGEGEGDPPPDDVGGCAQAPGMTSPAALALGVLLSGLGIRRRRRR